MNICKKKKILSVRPGDALCPQELLDARRAVEPAPAALLGPAVREVGLVVHGAVVDVYGTVLGGWSFIVSFFCVPCFV